MMLLGMPVTWLLAEVLVLVLFLACVVHATRQPAATNTVMVLLGFVLFASIFENIGVASGRYAYDQHRLALVGLVPVEVVVLEAVIFYAAWQLCKYLQIPWWGAPFVIGLFAMLQDLTIDPVAINDRYLYAGVLSGQWQWPHIYDGAFFGIPYYNFSGWYWFTVAYVFGAQAVDWLTRRTRQGWLLYVYPLAATLAALAVLLAFGRLFVDGSVFFGANSRTGEIIVLLLNAGLATFILLRYQRFTTPFNLRADWLLLAVPIALHLYDLIMAVRLDLVAVWVPVLFFSALHLGYLAWVVRHSRREAAAAPGALKPVFG